MTSGPNASPEPPAHHQPVPAHEPVPAAPVGDPGGPVVHTEPPKSAVQFTKMAAAWWALIVGLLVLVILLVFIGQNTGSTTIHFLGWDWSTPVAVAILVSAVCGSGITVLIGLARMVQLRRAARKNLYR
jgi:uncharacterized integral membrane protein